MKSFLDKLTSYNLFNNLFPGVIFVCALYGSNLTEFVVKYPVPGAFICYFIGMIVSRFGSLFIEPIIKDMVDWADYSNYIKASKLDGKIDELLESNNTYRTMISGLVLYCLSISIIEFDDVFLVTKNYPLAVKMGLVFFLIVLFFVSYKKQSNYIIRRVNEVCEVTDKKNAD